jgi:hypothetical protein
MYELLMTQPVRLSFQPFIFSQPQVFFSHTTNQSIVLSAIYFQRSEHAASFSISSTY